MDAAAVEVDAAELIIVNIALSVVIFDKTNVFEVAAVDLETQLFLGLADSGFAELIALTEVTGSGHIVAVGTDLLFVGTFLEQNEDTLIFAADYPHMDSGMQVAVAVNEGTWLTLVSEVSGIIDKVKKLIDDDLHIDELAVLFALAEGIGDLVHSGVIDRFIRDEEPELGRFFERHKESGEAVPVGDIGIAELFCGIGIDLIACKKLIEE